MTFLSFISLSNFSGWIAISLPFQCFHSEKGWWFECQKRQASNKMQKKQFWRPRPLFSVMVTSPTPCESLRTIRKKTNKKAKTTKRAKNKQGVRTAALCAQLWGWAVGAHFTHLDWLPGLLGGSWFPGLLGEELDFLPCRTTSLKQMMLEVLLLFEISKKQIGSEQISLLFKH